jgi:hypothetical protein
MSYFWGSEVFFFGDDSEECQVARDLLEKAEIPFVDKSDVSRFHQSGPEVHYQNQMWTGLPNIKLFVEHWADISCKQARKKGAG